MKPKGHHKGKMFTKGFSPWNKGELLTLSCQKCATSFTVQPYRKDAKFCSIPCARKGAKRPPRTEATKEKLRLAHTGKRGFKHSMETRLRMSEVKKGDRTHLWKGGITKLNDSIRRNVEYRMWREKVFQRDNWTCQECFARSCAHKRVILNADHIKPFAYFPELRFEVSNGKTLCIDCHKKTDTYAGKGRWNYKLLTKV